MAYEVIDTVKGGRLNLLLFKDYYIRVKFDRSVLSYKKPGTLLSFFSPFGEQIKILWLVKNNAIEVFDNKDLRTFTVVPHTDYEIKVAIRRNKFFLTIKGVSKNRFKKVYIGTHVPFMRFIKGPSIGELGQKIYFSHEKQ